MRDLHAVAERAVSPHLFGVAPLAEAPPVRVLSIGCSCINRFQFEFFVKRHPEATACFPRGLFDWNIASLDAALTALEPVNAQRLSDRLSDVSLFRAEYGSLIFNAALPGFSFFHEKDPEALLADPDRAAAFLGKLSHLAEPFIAPDLSLRTHIVWSNIQPNLPDTVENVIPWASFQLTQDRYIRAKDACRMIFGQGCAFSFISTPADLDDALSNQPDVHAVDLPRGPDYKGAPTLFEDILKNALS